MGPAHLELAVLDRESEAALDQVERVLAELLVTPAAQDIEVFADAGGERLQIIRAGDKSRCDAGVRKNLNILSGWRYEQFGKDALDLVEGRLAFAIENGKLKMSRVVTDAKERVDA
jgi:hypothetical protein